MAKYRQAGLLPSLLKFRFNRSHCDMNMRKNREAMFGEQSILPKILHKYVEARFQPVRSKHSILWLDSLDTGAFPEMNRGKGPCKLLN